MNLSELISQLRIKPVRLLILAAVFHLILTTTLFTVGRLQLMPRTFDADGTAISIVPDGVGLLKDAKTLSEVLGRGELGTWASLPYSFHIRFYSVAFFLFGRLLGFNILAAEPLNLLLYLAILILVHKLAGENFGSDAGLIASIIVGLWPSLLLHTTQLMKDSLFIVEMLGLILVLTHLLLKPFSYRRALAEGVAAGLLAILVWKTRSDQAVLLGGTVALGAILLLLKQLRTRIILAPNILAVLMVITMMSVAALFLPAYRTAYHPRKRNRQPQRQESGAGLRWWQVPAQIGNVRQRFIDSYPDFGSNVDTDVQINSTWELVSYMPRATAIGLFAPFPQMWFGTPTSVGSFTRKLSGLEMLALYGLECLAFLAVWRGRSRFSVWLLFSITMMGLLALGLIVVNIGTLYRLRYLFAILIIILASSEIARWLTRGTGETPADIAIK